MDLKQGDLENIILNAVWDLEQDGIEAIYVGEVQEKIKSPTKKWAYTTVKTVLDRLVDKQLANREKNGKKYLYRSVMKRDEAGMLAIQKVIHQYFQDDIDQMITCLKSLKSQMTPAMDKAPEKAPMFERTRTLNQLRETRQAVLSS